LRHLFAASFTFDYKQNKLRGSHLADAKADLLVYGMGEKSVLQSGSRQISAGLTTRQHRQAAASRLNDKEIDPPFVMPAG
jgi:hypothetical protein